MRRISLTVSMLVLTITAGTALSAENAQKMQEHPTIEVAFVLDTTGSMANLIDGAKKKIWSIANTIVDVNPAADIHMALVGYRDFGDDYVTRKYEMSSDIQALYGNLSRFQADGGNDTPEAVNEALSEAVEALAWSSDQKTRKIMFLVGDAPPHMDYQGPKYQAVLGKARAKGIIVNTVQAGIDAQTRRFWQEMAQIGGGRYIQIEQNGGQLQNIDTPFDDQILELQRKIDVTVIPYGDEMVQKKVRGKMEAKAAASSRVQLDNSAFYSKRSVAKEVITGGGDLIGDIRNGYKKLSDIKHNELPKDLQGLSQTDLEAFVIQKAGNRSRLEAEMSALIAKRDAYIAKEKAIDEKATSFDAVVSETLAEQLK